MNVVPKWNIRRFDYNNNKFALNLKRYQIGFDYCFSQHKIVFYAQNLHFILNWWRMAMFAANLPNSKHLRYLFFFPYNNDMYFGFQLLFIFQKVQFVCRISNVKLVDCRGVCSLLFCFSSFHSRISNELLFVIIFIIIEIMYPWHRYICNIIVAFHLLYEINMMRMKQFLINEQPHVPCIFSHNFHSDCFSLPNIKWAMRASFIYSRKSGNHS